MRKKGFVPIILLILIGVIISVVSYYLGRHWNNSSVSSVSLMSSPSALSVPSPIENINQTTNWKIYSDSTYSFKYPPEWKVEAGNSSQKEYWGGKDSVTIIAPSPTVSIDITPGSSPYGFGGPNKQMKGATLSTTIGGKEYTFSENVRTEDGITKVFVDFVIPNSETYYHVLFGTGYPVNQDDTASLSDYMKYRDTTLQILSTLKISKP